MRIKFSSGKQKDFLVIVLDKTGCPSLRELNSRIVGTTYSGLKNYFTERRLLPKELFEDLCKISEINQKNFNFKILNEHWGQSKGGKISRK